VCSKDAKRASERKHAYLNNILALGSLARSRATKHKDYIGQGHLKVSKCVQQLQRSVGADDATEPLHPTDVRPAINARTILAQAVDGRPTIECSLLKQQVFIQIDLMTLWNQTINSTIDE
jgi:hypothetical protein